MVLNVIEKNNKLVTADACQRIAWSHYCLEALGYFDEKFIAGAVAKTVINSLETVEVQITKREPLVCIGRFFNRFR